MDAFGYLSVLLSIVVGLGLTQILTATGRLIRHREHVRGDWLPFAWAGLLVLVFVQVWWSMFGLRRVIDWTFVRFLVVLAQAITLYMMAAVVLPEQVDERGVDLTAYYERQHRWFFGFFLATLAISVLKDVVLGGALPSVVNLGFHVVFAMVCVAGLVARRRRQHELLAVASVGALAAYVAVLFARLR